MSGFGVVHRNRTIQELQVVFWRNYAVFLVLLALVSAGELLLPLFLPFLFFLAFAKCRS